MMDTYKDNSWNGRFVQCSWKASFTSVLAKSKISKGRASAKLLHDDSSTFWQIGPPAASAADKT